MKKGNQGRTDCRMLRKRQKMEKEEAEKMVSENMTDRK